MAETILDSGDTLLTILGDILDFSKIDHNSMTLEAEPLDLRTTVEAVIEMVAADAVRKGIEIAYSLDEPLLHRLVMGDAIRIRQVRTPIRLDLLGFPHLCARRGHQDMPTQPALVDASSVSPHLVLWLPLSASCTLQSDSSGILAECRPLQAAIGIAAAAGIQCCLAACKAIKVQSREHWPCLIPRLGPCLGPGQRSLPVQPTP